MKKHVFFILLVLSTACSTGNSNNIEILNSPSLLRKSVLSNDITTVKNQLSRYPRLANHRYKDQSIPLLVAGCKGRIEMIQILIDNGARIDDRWNGFTPLAQSIICMKTESAKVFIQNNAQLINITKDGQSALHLASQKGLNKIIQILIEDKELPIDLRTKNEFEVSPLHDAALEGQVETVVLLLELGASINILSNDGWTPLDDAISKNHVTIIDLLESKGAISNRNR